MLLTVAFLRRPEERHGRKFAFSRAGVWWFFSFFLLCIASFQDTLEAATTWPLNRVTMRQELQDAYCARGPRSLKDLATSTSITAPSALNLPSLSIGDSCNVSRSFQNYGPRMYLSPVLPRQNNKSYCSGVARASPSISVCGMKSILRPVHVPPSPLILKILTNS